MYVLLYYESFKQIYLENIHPYVISLGTLFQTLSAPELQTFKEYLNPWFIIGMLGIGLFMLLVLWRLLFRLRATERFTSTHCPKCDYPLSRIKRTNVQRMFSKIVPVRKFYCKRCRWNGLRIKPYKPIPLNVNEHTLKSTNRAEQIDKIDMNVDNQK